MNDIVERLIEAVEAERLDEPLVFIFLAEAYLDIFDKGRDIEMDVALEQVNDELSAAYRGSVHYRAVNIALCAVIIEICRGQLAAVAESVEIDFPASGELLHFLNELVELGGVFDLTHAPVLGESEVVLRADALDEIGRDLFFGYVFVLALCLEDGGACIRRTLGIDGEIILRAAVGVAAQGFEQLDSRLAYDFNEPFIIAERRSGKTACELGDTGYNYLLRSSIFMPQT